MTGRENYNPLRENRQGILLHYDGSLTDVGAVAWLTKDPRCQVSYNAIVLDDGTVVPIAPLRAWHAGRCQPQEVARPRLWYVDANSALYGFAFATTIDVPVTPAARTAMLALCRRTFKAHAWPLTDAWRITSHHLEAWPRRRKVDVRGDGDPVVLDLAAFRHDFVGYP